METLSRMVLALQGGSDADMDSVIPDLNWKLVGYTVGGCWIIIAFMFLVDRKIGYLCKGDGSVLRP